jgi:hypothetical protein
MDSLTRCGRLPATGAQRVMRNVAQRGRNGLATALQRGATGQGPQPATGATGAIGTLARCKQGGRPYDAEEEPYCCDSGPHFSEIDGEAVLNRAAWDLAAVLPLTQGGNHPAIAPIRR